MGAGRLFLHAGPSAIGASLWPPLAGAAAAATPPKELSAVSGADFKLAETRCQPTPTPQADLLFVF